MHNRLLLFWCLSAPLGVLQGLLTASRVLFPLWFLYVRFSMRGVDGIGDILLVVVGLVLSWWTAGQLRNAVKSLRKMLFLAMHPELVDNLASLSDEEKKELHEDMNGGPIATKLSELIGFGY
jgi:hypothetical protein